MISYETKRQQILRAKVLQKLGSMCGHCGNSDIRVLQVDHINGGGSKELKRVGGITRLTLVLKDTEDKYQLLCANCNWIKRHENREVQQGERWKNHIPKKLEVPNQDNNG